MAWSLLNEISSGAERRDSCLSLELMDYQSKRIVMREQAFAQGRDLALAKGTRRLELQKEIETSESKHLETIEELALDLLSHGFDIEVIKSAARLDEESFARLVKKSGRADELAGGDPNPGG